MDEALIALLETLAEIQRELGRRVFEGAVERARIAVAAEVMVEAERRALRSRTQGRDSNIVYLRTVDQPGGGDDAGR